MQAFPHRYRVRGSGRATGDVELSADRLTTLRSASPAEFEGPGDRWSPETLLVGAVADCFILTFRAIAKASRLSWVSLECDVTGTLDRVDRVARFTDFTIAARLIVTDERETGRARHALEKAEANCLISRSLNAAMHLNATVDIAEAGELAGSADRMGDGQRGRRSSR